MTPKEPNGSQDALRLPPMTRRAQFFSMILFFLAGAVLTWVVVGNPLGMGFLPGAESETAVPDREDQVAARQAAPAEPQPSAVGGAGRDPHPVVDELEARSGKLSPQPTVSFSRSVNISAASLAILTSVYLIAAGLSPSIDPMFPCPSTMGYLNEKLCAILTKAS